MAGNRYIFFFNLILFLNGVNLQNLDNKARYDYYRLYRVHLDTVEHVKLFQEVEEKSDSFTFYGHARKPDQDLTILVAAHKIADMTDIMKRYNVTGKVLEYNYQSQIDNEAQTIKPPNTDPKDFCWTHYFHLETINKWLEMLAQKHYFIKIVELTPSYEGIPIKGIKLSKKLGNPAIFVEGGIHSREWISPATATFILNQLITSNSSDIIDLATNFDWYFFPVVNPDGYKNTFENDRLWRKNRKPYGICRGVDLNRNFDSNWNGEGSSADPCSYDFAGGSVFSEPEARAIANFIEKNKEKENIMGYIALHSYSQYLMFPFGHTPERVPNYDDLTHITKKAISALTAVHGTYFKGGSKYETIYPSSGGSIDWAYQRASIPISFTFELRGPPDSTEMFLLPADQIIPVGEETMAAFITIVQEGRNLGYFNKK